MKLFQELLSFCFLIVVCYCLDDKCPTRDIKPCSCRTYLDGACIVTCSLASQADVDRIADIPNLCDGHVHFVLVHSKAKGIPARLWKTLLSSKTVDITIKHVSIKGLVLPGSGSIPKVFTPGTAVIKVDHAYVEEWDWRQLSSFTSGDELTIVVDDTPLPELDEAFASIAGGKVHKVTIDSAGLTKIRDDQFASFYDLSSLSLQNNELTTISRSLLPKSAKELQYLHLNGNKLSSIPSDMFSEMPSLEVVYLRDNNLKTLPEELFQSVSTNLQRVDLVNNPWECDCKLLSILKNTKTFVNLGLCASPPLLAKQWLRWG